MKYRVAVFLLMCSLVIKTSFAEVVVRMEIQQAATINLVDVKLLSDDAPLTVTNFLNYVDSGDYNNSFIHRSVPGFIIQGGGFTYTPLVNDGTFSNDPLLNNYPGGLQPIPVGPEVVNEFGHSNLRGTIAMAKLGDQPDSATNQWFFNLGDNSTNLDNQNGGFTVFGEVLNTGMNIIDDIANKPVCDRSNIHAVFGSLPLDNCASDPVQVDNLMYIKTVKQLFSITPDISFGLVAVGTSLQSEIVIENTGNEILLLDEISSINLTGTAFTMVSTTCSSSMLNPGETCNIVVQFVPVTSGSSYSGSFNIVFPDLGLNYEIILSGLGGSSLDEFFTITPVIDFGIVASGSGVQPEVTIINTGSDPLLIGSIASSNPVVLPFSLEDIGCENTIIQPGKQCSFLVRFKPESVASYTDSLNIEINSHGGISYEVSLLGEGGVAEVGADIHLSFSSFDYGVVDVLENDLSLPYKTTLIVQNLGGQDMTPFTINIIGTNAADVYVEGSCVDMDILSAGTGCSLLVRFKPLTSGVKNAIISINTNDPDENPFNIPITGTAIGEDDGVPDEIENAGPNNGDGNNDGILDSMQGDVATLIDSSGNYVTYIAKNGLRFRNMSVLQTTEAAQLPVDLKMGSGIFDFVVDGALPGELIEIGIILPTSLNVDTYYVYGETSDTPVQHWFDFDYDGDTGSFILGNVVYTTSTGTTFTRSLISLVLKDGGRGDTDMTVNGSIAMTSIVTVKKSSSGGSGSIHILELLLLCFFISVRHWKRAK